MSEDMDMEVATSTVTASSGKFDKIMVEMRDNQVPIIYSVNYTIQSFGIEKCHPFDVSKWGKILKFLIQKGLLERNQVVEPKQVGEEELLEIHSQRYLTQLKSSRVVSLISEVCVLQFFPSCVLRRILLKPLQFQVGGSILGVKLAMERGWAINLGGGFHHCSRSKGGGFCFYADISLCVKFALSPYFEKVQRIMIVDLDAHQGNGYALDVGPDKRVFILDAFNQRIYPRDSAALKNVRCPIFLQPLTGDEEYLEKVERQLKLSLEDFPPHLVIYNAGTDCLQGDPLGCLSITPAGIIRRDELVFKACVDREIPILMLTSGGYLPSTAQIIADSIANLVEKNIIFFSRTKPKTSEDNSSVNTL